MAKSKKKDDFSLTSFSHFLSDPLISSALVVFALIALFMSIVELSQALSY